MEHRIKVITLPLLAKKLGVHRSTLKRMEDRGLIPKAKWIERPIKGRVYTEAEANEIERIVSAEMANRTTGRGELTIPASALTGATTGGED